MKAGLSLYYTDFNKSRSPGKWRAVKMDSAIQTAINERLPIRIIVLRRRGLPVNRPKESAYRACARLLDPVPWSVVKYDWQNGDCIVKRGGDCFVDQFSIGEGPMQPPERRTVSGQAFKRNPEVREKVLLRANGKCEWCETPGFVTTDGKIYLETHHIISLCEDGFDRVGNVAALCANHHREAHHGKNKAEMREILLKRFGG